MQFPIEGFNFSRFLYGTSNAVNTSLQFKAAASNPGTYSGAIMNYAATRCYPFTYTIAVANTPVLVTIPNVLGDTGGAWVGNTNAGAAYVIFDLGSGSNFRGIVNSWQAGGFTTAIGATAFVSQTNGSLLTISDVQLEASPICTLFERKLYAGVLVDCQRYQQYPETFVQGYAPTANQIAALIPLSVAMRATPTVNIGSPTYTNANSATLVSFGNGAVLMTASVTATGVGVAQCLNNSVFSVI
jgi:hypothetical protein